MIHFKPGKILHLAAPTKSEKKTYDQLGIDGDDFFLTQGGALMHPSNSFRPVTVFLHAPPWTASHWRQDVLLRIRIILAKWKLERVTKELRDSNGKNVPITNYTKNIMTNRFCVEAAIIKYNSLINLKYLRQCSRNYYDVPCII